MKRVVLAAVCGAIATLVLGTTASLSASPKQAGATSGKITVAVYFLDAAGKQLPTEAIPEDLTLQLGAVPGSLGGSARASLQTLRIGRDKAVQLDLADLSEKLATQAAQFGESDDTRLDLTPRDTHFARVSTDVSFSSGPPTALATLFWDVRANGGLALMYCDRPCRLRAYSPLNSADDFHFEAPSAGLVWMLSKKDRHAHFMHTRAANPHPVLVICPPEALDKIAGALAR
jgi:hypothetical protein